jgi:F-type H+-transporting ATPase subunit alpha
MKQVAGTVKLELAQFRELAAFAQFGSDLDDATKAKLERGKRIVEVFKQPQFQPVSVPMQVAILWAVQNGYFDDVDVDAVKQTQNAIVDYLNDSKADLVGQIATEGAVTDAVEAGLKAALDEFKAQN